MRRPYERHIVDERAHVGWDLRLEIDRCSSDWMRQPNAPGMKSLARNRRAGHSIRGIAENGPAARGQVHAYLMRASGDEFATNERGVPVKRCHHLVARLAWRASIGDDHPATVGEVASEWKRDGSSCGLRRSLYDGQIRLIDAASSLIALHRRVHLGREGHHNKSRGILVEPCENARLGVCTIAHTPQHAVEQRP